MKKVSVVIPAYNAEKFIRTAVESALAFKEVEEVILVEDGSPDNTLNVCRQLAGESERVKLYTHPENKNLGAGASRTLGVKKAICDFIAFLDADDYYLANRFDAEKKIFPDRPDADGVYGAVATHFLSGEAEKLFKEIGHPELLTVNKIIPPQELKYDLLGMSNDPSVFFSLDALTIKKSVIEKADYFNEKLRLHQDTDFIIKLAFIGNLVPGSINEPVATRGIHEYNRITSGAYGFKSRYLQFSELEKWLNANITGEDKIKRFVRKEKIKYQELSLKNNIITRIKRLINLLRNEPYLIYLQKDFELLIKGMFGDNFLTKAINKSKEIIFRLICSKRIDYWRGSFYR